MKMKIIGLFHYLIKNELLLWKYFFIIIMNNVCKFIQNNTNTKLNTYIYIEQYYNECKTFYTYFDVFNYVSLKLRKYFGDNIINIESIIDNNQHIIKFDVNNHSGEIWETIENENENYWVVSLFNINV
jgi:hypothetical protein